MHQRLSFGHAHDGGIIRGMQPDQHVRVLARGQTLQRSRQHAGADLGPAAAAAHRQCGQGLVCLLLIQLGCQVRMQLANASPECLPGSADALVQPGKVAGIRGVLHAGQFIEASHELAVDMVLPAPQPRAQTRRDQPQLAA